MQDNATHLQDFAHYCRTILHNSAPSGEFRHSEVNSQSNIHYKLKKTCLLTRSHSLGNGSELLTHWHPSCGWHWTWPHQHSVMVRLVLTNVILCACHVNNFRDNFECLQDSGTRGQFPGLSRKSRDSWQVCYSPNRIAPLTSYRGRSWCSSCS